VTDCLCDEGHTGTITDPTDTCDACAAGSYKTGTGDGVCEDCPADSNTASDGSTTIDDCLCDAGYTGTIADPADTCEACGAAEYKEDAGPAACDDCPANSDSAPASTAVTACECDAGYSGIIEDTCECHASLTQYAGGLALATTGIQQCSLVENGSGVASASGLLSFIAGTTVATFELTRLHFFAAAVCNVAAIRAPSVALARTLGPRQRPQ
jgi:hypothetical protein